MDEKKVLILKIARKLWVLGYKLQEYKDLPKQSIESLQALNDCLDDEAKEAGISVNKSVA